MKIKKGDKVKVISGSDKGKTGTVLIAFPKEGKVIIEGVNMKKRHMRPKKQGEKGTIVSKPGPMRVSKVKSIEKASKK